MTDITIEQLKKAASLKRGATLVLKNDTSAFHAIAKVDEEKSIVYCLLPEGVHALNQSEQDIEEIIMIPANVKLYSFDEIMDAEIPVAVELSNY
ncbi:MAG TPA: hypothetical protein VF455_00550 [Chryseobacterium sp.]